jgi:hypothetical protein
LRLKICGDVGVENALIIERSPDKSVEELIIESSPADKWKLKMDKKYSSSVVEFVTSLNKGDSTIVSNKEWYSLLPKLRASAKELMEEMETGDTMSYYVPNMNWENFSRVVPNEIMDKLKDNQLKELKGKKVDLFLFNLEYPKIFVTKGRTKKQRISDFENDNFNEYDYPWIKLKNNQLEDIIVKLYAAKYKIEFYHYSD